MASFNKITILGYLGRDPEVRYLPDSTAVCGFSVATTERRKDRNGEAQDVTTWFKVTVWGKQGELASQYLFKGSQVYIEGRLSQQEYTDRDGNPRTSLEVRANDVQFLDRKPQGEDREAERPASKRQAERTPKYDDEGDIPF